MTQNLNFFPNNQFCIMQIQAMTFQAGFQWSQQKGQHRPFAVVAFCSVMMDENPSPKLLTDLIGMHNANKHSDHFCEGPSKNGQRQNCRPGLAY